MPKLKQIYRFLAAAALIAVVANVAIPSGLAAAKYFCYAEFVELSGNADAFGECCTPADADTGDLYQPTDLKEEFCLTARVCEQALTTDFSETRVILPVAPQFFAASPTAGPSFISPLTNTYTSLSLNSAVSDSNPPIHLLNCVFLN